jgi:hypothetical protein
MLGFHLALCLAWRLAGTEDTYKAHVKRFAYATRYGHAGAWLLDMPSYFVQDFVEATGEIVEEENRPKK